VSPALVLQELVLANRDTTCVGRLEIGQKGLKLGDLTLRNVPIKFKNLKTMNRGIYRIKVGLQGRNSEETCT